MQAHKILTAVLRNKGGPLKIESLDLEGPRDDEVLVRLVATGICRTDIDFCDHWDRTDGAVVLGHEGAGVVEQVGKRVKRVRRGDHVVLSYQSCGGCRECRNGHPADCEYFYEVNFGFMRLDGSGTDAFPQGRKTVHIIQGDAVPQRFIPKMIELFQAGQFPFDRLVRFYNFSEINRAIADARQAHTIKPMLRISDL